MLAKRSLLRIPRQPDLLVGFTVQPVMFVLLFVYVFGGAIETPGFDYVDFLMPGIIVQSMVFGGFVTALGLAEDLKKGLIDRFRSLPMWGPAVLTGRIARGRRDERDPARRHVRGRDRGRLPLLDRRPGGDRRHRAAAADRLRLLLGVRLHRARGVVARGIERVRVHDPLPAHVRLLGLRARRVDAGLARSRIAEANPFTTMVDAARALFLGTPAGNDVWGAVVWSLAIIAVFGAARRSGATAARSPAERRRLEIVGGVAAAELAGALVGRRRVRVRERHDVLRLVGVVAGGDEPGAMLLAQVVGLVRQAGRDVAERPLAQHRGAFEPVAVEEDDGAFDGVDGGLEAAVEVRVRVPAGWELGDVERDALRAGARTRDAGDNRDLLRGRCGLPVAR